MRSRVEEFRGPSQKQSPRVGEETLLLEKIQFCLQKPLDQRCEDVRRMIETFSIEDLHLLYPHLLASIFGFSSTKSWPLHSPYSRYAEGLCHFLGPRGVVWRLVEKLERDTFLRYEFPVSCLPKPSRSSLAEGHIPPFYFNKVHFSGGNQVSAVVRLGALEYFLFQFAYFITHSQSSSQIDGRSVSERSHDTIYTALFTDYLEHFLPANISLMTKDAERYPLTSTAYCNKTEQKRLFNTPGESYLRTSTPFTGLIKSFENKPSPYNVPSFEQQSTQLIQSELFVQVLMEFWLNHIVDNERNAFSAFVQDYYLPSIDHVRVVRMLVKHLHTFMNVNMAEYEGAQPMEVHKDFYRSFMPETLRLFKRSLFGFIHHCFVQWPLDSSFRFILETWLSYIQPWRYGLDQQKQTNIPQAFTPFWIPFVRSNLLFYTVMFQEFLNRAEKLNLRSSRDTQLFYRVAKVFSQKSLMATVREVEEDLLSYLSSTQPHLRGSPRSPKLPEYIHFMELCNVGIVYTPLFVEETINSVRCLLRHIRTTLRSLREPQSRDSAQSSHQNIGWVKRQIKGALNWIQDVFAIDEQYWLVLDENRKAEKNLEHIYEQLRGIFQLTDETDVSERTLDHVDQVDSGISAISRVSSGDSSPDCIETEHGMVLTALGKYQMANGLRRFNIQYSGDPDLQPIRSYELVFLVRALHKLSTLLNEKFGVTLTHIYYSPGWSSSLARYLSPGVHTPRIMSPVKYNNHNTGTQTSASGLGQPKISLRFLASSRLWAQLFVFMCIFVFILGRPWSALLIVLLILVIMFLRHIHVVKPNIVCAKPEHESCVT